MGTLLFSVTAVATPGNTNGAATITESFGDSCRDFEGHSSKDVSHVEIHHADGRVVKDESIESPDYSAPCSFASSSPAPALPAGVFRVPPTP